MSDLKEQERLRDSIAGVLELSRTSWKVQKLEKINAAMERKTNTDFPRSKLFQTITSHPYMTAIGVASVWIITPARFGALAVAGASLVLRHRKTLFTFVEHFIASNVLESLFNAFTEDDSEEKSKEHGKGQGRPQAYASSAPSTPPKPHQTSH